MTDDQSLPFYREEAERHLRWLHPDGPWTLTAIPPGGGKTATSTLFDIRAALGWAEARNEREGVYVSVARLRGAVDKKASKVDVEAVGCLWVDIDPPKGIDPADMDEWRATTAERARAFSPTPSLIASSGGGVHIYWRLDRPMSGDDAAEMETVEACNRWLACELGGDKACVNVDRILRLCGSRNLKPGRPLSRAEVLFERDAVHPIAAFQRIDAGDGAPAEGAGKAASASLPDTLPDVDLNALKLTPPMLALIATGDNPDEPGRYPSRSEASWAVTCAMVRAGHDDATIGAVLLDRDLPIADHTRDKGREYVKRQIGRAREEVASSWPMRSVEAAVDWINGRYFAALEGRSVTYFREDHDRVQPMDDRAFHFELADREVLIPNQDGDDKRFAASKLWVGNARRRYYPRGFVIDPAGDRDPRAYNLWRGFGVEALPGDWSLMEAHIRGPLSGGVAEYADYIIKWFAWTVQNPATPPRVALVFRGGEGVGKGIVATSFYTIFGHHGTFANSMDQIAGRFNSHLRHCCFLVADEIEPSGRGDGGKLRNLITERHVSIEGKGKDIIQAENHLHVVMLSNERWVVPAGKDSRRYAVFDVSAERQRDHDYFAAIARQMDGGGREAMLHDLLALDLGGFHPERGRPDTDALADQRAHSLSGFEKVFFDLLATGDLPPLHATEELGGGAVFVATSELADFAARRLRREDVSWTEVGELFNRLGFEKVDRRPRGYVLPRLRDARAAWARVAFDYPWNDVSGWGLPDTSDFDGPDPY